MVRTTDVAIVAVPLVVCVAVFAALGLMGRTGTVVLTAPGLPIGLTSAGSTPTPTVVATPAQAATTPQITATGDQASAKPGTVPPGTATSPSLARGRELADLLYSQQLGPLWKVFAPSVRQEWGSFEKFQAYRSGGLNAFGAEKRVVAEEVRRSGDVEYYTRTATFERGPKHDWTLVFGLGPAGQVVEFNIVAAGVLPGTGQPGNDQPGIGQPGTGQQ